MKSGSVEISVRDGKAIAGAFTAELDHFAESETVIAAGIGALEAAGAHVTREGVGMARYRVNYPTRRSVPAWGWFTIEGAALRVTYNYELRGTEEAEPVIAEANAGLGIVAEAIRLAAGAARPMLDTLGRILADERKATEAAISASASATLRVINGGDAAVKLNADNAAGRLDVHAERLEEIEYALTERAEAIFEQVAALTVDAANTDERIGEVEADAKMRLDAIDRLLGADAERLNAIEARLDGLRERAEFACDLARENGRDLGAEIDALKRIVGHGGQVAPISEPEPEPSALFAEVAERIATAREHGATHERIFTFNRCAYFRCGNYTIERNSIRVRRPSSGYLAEYVYCSQAHADADAESGNPKPIVTDLGLDADDM